MKPNVERLEDRCMPSGLFDGSLGEMRLDKYVHADQLAREGADLQVLAQRVQVTYTINRFQAILEEGNIYTLQGVVTGRDLENVEIRFGGLRSLEGKTARVGVDGTFSLTTRIPEGDGTATAQVFRNGRPVSNLALALIRQP